METKMVAENRRARFDYEILETLEAGISLQGHEVKSVKGGRMNLSGSYGVIQEGELWLLNADVPAYQPKNAPEGYDPHRLRRLLIHRKEINALIGRLNEKGLTLVPLKAYLKKGLIKIELGLARSKKKGDKREGLKKRAAEREIRAQREE
ncbi:MAG: SsrA-binding protein SmpB [bacterium]|nr:SsrA-binding protein SmpB [bacterium]